MNLEIAGIDINLTFDDFRLIGFQVPGLNRVSYSPLVRIEHLRVQGLTMSIEECEMEKVQLFTDVQGSISFVKQHIYISSK